MLRQLLLFVLSLLGTLSLAVPTSLGHRKSDTSLISEWSEFSYDGVFNLIDVSTSGHTFNTGFNGILGFAYTSKDQLATESSTRFGDYVESNVWDASGNPTTFRNASGRTYNNSNQRTNTGYVYDGNGNPTTHGGTSATYDEENRMLTYGSATYTYRADGLRASDGTGSSKKYYLYDGGNAICRLDSSGNLDRTYVFAPDGLVGWSIPGSTSHQMLFDWQGNLEHSTTPAGSVATSHAYNAWGQRNSVFPINAVTGANDRFGYNARWGYVRDTTGLYYCQNRYYDPANGRWLNRDPIGYAGGMNLYGYCGGGPVGAADPSGLQQNFGGTLNSYFGVPDGGNAKDLWEVAGRIGTTISTGPSPSGDIYRLFYGGCDGDMVMMGKASLSLVLFLVLSGTDVPAFRGPVDDAVETLGPKLVPGASKLRPLPFEDGVPDKFPHEYANGGHAFTGIRWHDGKLQSAQTYDADGFGVHRIDFFSRSGRKDHAFPHWVPLQWHPSSRVPGGAPQYGDHVDGLP